MSKTKRGVEEKRGGLANDLLKGAVAGAAGWFAMDQVLRFLYNHEGPSVRDAEEEARGGIPALEVMAERTAGVAGVSLTVTERQGAGTALQWAVPIGLGMAYGVLRDRLPRMNAGRGLAFGAGILLVVDEGLIPLLGFAPGPGAFPWQTHARGLAGHLVYGLVAEAALAAFNRLGGGACMCRSAGQRAACDRA